MRDPIVIKGMNLEQVGEVSVQGVTGEAIPAKLIKIDVRLCETPSDTGEENRTNQVKFMIFSFQTNSRNRYLQVYCSSSYLRKEQNVLKLLMI